MTNLKDSKIEIKGKKLNDRIKKLQETHEKIEKDLHKLVMHKYSTCKHFVIVSSNDYDSREGRSYVSYGCIKCGIDNNLEMYSGLEREYMEEYLHQYRGGIPGYYADLDVDFFFAKRLCEEILNESPNVSHKKLYDEIKSRAENYERKRTRVQEEPRSIWDWPL